MYPCDEVGRPDSERHVRLPPSADADTQPEKDRMDIYHKLFAVARGDKLHQAPIPQHWDPRILDVGCGTGIWAIDMAE
jgi:2-polyprenyl-3-methyl-5-hydroxy-6-metoxy-1,4-benzoquinol methylase